MYYFCDMIQVGDALISDDVLNEEFVCNLQACKGICCVEGDAGAPLLDEEVEILKKEYPNFKRFLREEGVDAIEEQGTHTHDNEEAVTPLVNNCECAYAVFEEDGTASCGIERAWEAGETSFRKPISCHLYPVRIKEFPTFTAVNYHRWSICDDACVLGAEYGIKVYQFLKEPLIRKFGESWFEELEEAVESS